jgi:small subunit ribosomal protein S17
MSSKARKTLEGIVVSDKMKKTVVVEVERRFRHSFYAKVVRSSKRYKAHDEGGVAKVGDVVRMVETRPISKEKRFAVVEVVLKAKGAGKKEEA